MRKILIVSLALLTLSGCSAALGNFPQTSDTQVQLAKDNYRIIRPDVKGSSHGFSLLGIIPLSQPSYVNALSDLCDKGYRSASGSVALANVAQEYQGTYLILFSIPKITVRADIIEFTKE